jgi:hypothetical protein
VVIGGVRFTGATRWTGYRIFGDANTAAVRRVCATGRNDHRRLGRRKKPCERFRPQEAARLPQQPAPKVKASLTLIRTD